MKEIPQESRDLSGSLLVAHPSLLDPNFRRTVVLISAYSSDSGVLGVVINRPMGKTLGDLDDGAEYGALADVKLYSGGPVNTSQMILTAWAFNRKDGMFKLYFGLSPEKAMELVEQDPSLELRAYLGYSGWGSGQLEDELAQSAWLVTSIDTEFVKQLSAKNLWLKLLTACEPDLRFIAEVPDDPSMN